MYRLHLAGQPGEVPDEVVFRIAPHEAMGAKELSVQRTLADQGFPTPRVRLTGLADDELGGSWSVMDFAPGSPPMSGLDGLAAVRRAPRLLRGLPRLLATAMAELHSLDPGPATDAVRSAAPTVAWSIDELLDHFGAAAEVLEQPDLVGAVLDLARTRPSDTPTVICHGDLHPFNLLVDDARTTVIDWTGALRAEAAYDVAFTELLLANPPLDASPTVAAIVGRAGRLLSRRFVRAYGELAPANDLSSLAWFRGLHGIRILLEGASKTGDEHPFAALVPAATTAIAAVTGAQISPT
jgi:aminoglycoside phosphotransferase (APT) family kinase protein